MKEDINIPKVENIGVAIVKETIEGDETWNVYLINFRDEPIVNTLVSSKGYGQIDGRLKKTVTFSHYLEDIPAKSYKLIEPISEEVFPLTNEYFVTFYINKEIYDKKYLFVPESIKTSNFTSIKVLGKKGVLIK